jgi:hypothetical protein
MGPKRKATSRWPSTRHASVRSGLGMILPRKALYQNVLRLPFAFMYLRFPGTQHWANTFETL